VQQDLKSRRGKRSGRGCYLNQIAAGAVSRCAERAQTEQGADFGLRTSVCTTHGPHIETDDCSAAFRRGPVAAWWWPWTSCAAVSGRQRTTQSYLLSMPSTRRPSCGSGSCASPLSTTRLVTRTKERNSRASRRVAKPRRRNESVFSRCEFRKKGSIGRRVCVARRHAAALEHAGCRPRDGELCRARAKPRESLVEARHGDNVQISSLKLGIVATDSSNHLVAGFRRHFS
jgi:hypothetical protein